MTDENLHRRKGDNDRSSLEIGWGGRTFKLHGLLVILVFFVLLVVVGLPLYKAWTAPAPIGDVMLSAAESLAKVTAGQHAEILSAIMRSNEEVVYTQLLTEHEKDQLRRRLAVPKRFREGGEPPPSLPPR